MSRIGKLPISIPKDVTATMTGSTVTIKGKKGELVFTAHPAMTVAIKDNQITVARGNDEKSSKALHGTTRAILSNMVKGVMNGYEKKLEVRGVGYRFVIAGKKMTFSLGFSHPVTFNIPVGIAVAVDAENKNVLTISGPDKQLVGETAARIRGLKVPEIYKGKGIRYFGEHITLKQGKKAAKAVA